MNTRTSPWQRPWVVALFLAFFVALHAPSLGWGFFADDWGHRLVLEHPESQATMRPWNLYDFGDAASAGELYFEDAILPWWTDPEWKARFFRPVSSCVLWFEHALFGRNAPALHACGLLWHGLYLLLAWRLFRAVGLTGGVALLALALLALEDGAAMTVGWIANRNSVVEGVFAAGALACAIRARAEGRAPQVLLALALATLSAGSKESGLAALAGCALLLGTSPRRTARVGGVAAILLALAFLAFLALAGYGVRCQLYPTPWGEPARWAQNLFGLLTAGPLATLGPFPVDVLLLPGGYWPLIGISVALLALLVRPWWRALRSLELGPILALFALAALVPQASAPPSDRLLYVPALGLAPISALMLARALRPVAVGRWERRLAWGVALCALPLSGAMLLARGSFMPGVSRDLERVFLEAELERAPPERRDVFLLQSPSVLAALGPLAAWRCLTGDPNTRFHALQFGRRGLRWTRLDQRTFELESLDEPFVDSLFEGVFLAPGGLRPGASYRTSAFEVRALGEGPVRRLRFACAAALESPSFVFLSWSEGRWRSLPAPLVGQALEIEAGLPLRPFLP